MSKPTFSEYIGKFTELDAMHWKLTPLVRCKDCKYYHLDIKTCEYLCDVVKKDDYCSWGERGDSK